MRSKQRCRVIRALKAAAVALGKPQGALVQAFHPKERFRNLFEAFERWGDENDVYVHFTNIPKLGVNPTKKSHRDPHGVYFYPLSYLKKGFYRSQYATNAKYAFIVQLNKNETNGYVLNQMTGREVARIAKANGWLQGLQAYLKIGGWTLKEFLKVEYEAGRSLWGAGDYLVNELKTTTWEKMLKGIDWLEDGGWSLDGAIINNHEPEQIVVFHPKVIHVLELVDNKSDFVGVTKRLVEEVADHYAGKLTIQSDRRQVDFLVDFVVEGYPVQFRLRIEKPSSKLGKLAENYMYLHIEVKLEGRWHTKKEKNLKIYWSITGVNMNYDDIKKAVFEYNRDFIEAIRSYADKKKKKD